MGGLALPAPPRRRPGTARHHLEALAPIRDQVIANAALAPGHTVLDVGCGDGLIAFAAAEAVGPTENVIFSDVSSELLERCRELAAQRGLLDRWPNMIDPPAWVWSAWMELTDKGERLARALEESARDSLE